MLQKKYPRLHSHSFAIVSAALGMGGIVVVLMMLFTIQNINLAKAAMSSTNYRTLSEDFNCSGGQSNSTTYRLLDSVCDFAKNGLSSSTYRVDSGFPGMEDIPFITFALSATSVPLGTLTTASVYTGSTTATITTNANSGYAATIVEDGNLRRSTGDDINDVGDGTVTAGSEEYGIRTTGSDGQYNSTDTAITGTPGVFASNAGPANSATTITFKAAISPLTVGGNYSHTVTIIATGTY